MTTATYEALSLHPHNVRIVTEDTKFGKCWLVIDYDGTVYNTCWNEHCAITAQARRRRVVRAMITRRRNKA